MIRFAFTFTLFLLIVGCKSAVHGPKSSVIVHDPSPVAPVKTFWSQTKKLFQPLLPDTDSRSADHHFTLHRSGSEILPIHHTPHSLYKAGSIFPSPHLTSPTAENHFLVAETGTTPSQSSAEDVESPEQLSEDTAAPLPDKELVAEKRPARPPLRKQTIELEYDDEEYDFDDEPIVRQIARKSLSRGEEPPVAQTPVSPPVPVYPSLTQLPSAALPSATPTMVQASYQQSMPPYAHQVSGYGAGDWQTPARQTLEQLRYAIEQTPGGRTMSNEMRLRMLEMLLGNKVESAKPMQSADKTVNAFMGHQVLGFAALLDDSIPDNRGRYISATYRFNEGLLELQNLCPFKLKNVMFVDDWLNFGQFIPRTRDFHPGETFMLYIELDNPTIRRTGDGYEVSIAIGYEIRDSQANVVAKVDVGKPAERTISRKRDYSIGFPGTLPTSLAPGQYQLRLSVTDLNDDSMQYAEEQIPFKVIPSQAGG